MTIMKCKKISISGLLLLLSVMFMGVCTANAEKLTPAQAVNKGALALRNAKGIKIEFSINAGGKNANGVLISKGQKFMIESPVGSSWYNGISLYTYNPRTKETTLTKPTAAELSEANPLSYIHGNAAYVATDMPEKKGKRMIRLTPNKSGLGVKNVVLTVDPTTCLPEVISITMDNGVSTTITVKSLQLDALPNAKVFEYPKSKFPQVEVIDMR